MPSLISRLRSRRAVNEPIVDFLPDADEIERRPLPRSAGLTLHLLAAALLVFLLLATFSEVDLMVAARGRLITPLPNIVVQPLDTAIIQEINVKPGQVVKKGERLATLDPTFTGADESQLRTRLASLDTQRESLEAELAGKSVAAGAALSDDQEIQSRLAGERQASYLAQTRRLDENIGRIRAALETNRRDQSGRTNLNLYAYDEYRLSMGYDIEPGTFVGMSLCNENPNVVTQWVFPAGLPDMWSFGQGGTGRAKEIAAYPWFEGHKGWQKEIEGLLANGVKMEVQSLITKDISYVTEEYVPARLKAKAWLD